MRRLILLLSLCFIMWSCGEGTGNGGDADSVSTDSIPDPSYDPRAETDSAARQMNLDSAQVESRP